ncbi:MAG: hypothetical protein B7C55_05290 [Actinomycetales bacterium mxb001]|nr:MAG: hypothetical protein B7C55_05290 [Actinomycetales bacterium mxb001]
MSKFFYINNLSDYKDACEQLNTGERLAIDTETYVKPEWVNKGGSALDPHTGTISLLIAKQEKNFPFVFDILCLTLLDYNPNLLIQALSASKYHIGVNYKFDIKFLKTTFNYIPSNVRDLLVMGRIISNATGSKMGEAHGHSYSDLCREYLNIHITGKKTLRVSDWGIAPKFRVLSNKDWYDKVLYAATDVQYLFKLHDIMYRAITSPLPHTPLIPSNNTSDSFGLGMADVLDRECKFIIPCAVMELNGLPVNKQDLLNYKLAVSSKLDSLSCTLCDELDLDPPVINWNGDLVPTSKAFKTIRSPSGLLKLIQDAFRLGKLDNVQSKTLTRVYNIIEALYSIKASDPGGDGEECTNSADKLEELFLDEEEALLHEELCLLEMSELNEKSKLLKLLLTVKALSKQESTKLERFINPSTGCIHSSISTNKAATGRTASSNPNFQQIPNIYHVEVDFHFPVADGS